MVQGCEEALGEPEGSEGHEDCEEDEEEELEDEEDLSDDGEAGEFVGGVGEDYGEGAGGHCCCEPD